MIPILYRTVTEGTVPSDYGLGALTDCLKCEVTEERNGSYELVLEYASAGIHAEDIEVNRFIKAKPNFTDDPQLFRIYKIGKALNGHFDVYAQHISYDLSGKIIKHGSAVNCASALSLLQASAGSFTLATTKTVTKDFTITAPSSVRSWFGGKEGSILDIYGPGEWSYDNYTASFKSARGQDRGVTIRYGKNLTELTQELDCSNLYTHVMAFWKGEGPLVSGSEISTGLTLDVNKVLVIDATQDFETEPLATELTTYASNYIGTHNLTAPTNNIKLNFQQTGELKDRVDLCDTATVYFEALGISAKFKCIRTKWDVLGERYIETEFGDPRSSIVDTINNTAAIAQNATSDASGKKRVFTSTPFPPYDVGDLWVDNGAIYVCNTARPSGYIKFLGETSTYIEEGSTTGTIVIDGNTVTAQNGDVVTYNGEEYIWTLGLWTAYNTHIFIDWELATNYVDNSALETAIATASDLITGTVGGLIILHDTNNDGAPDEIIITNDNDFTQNTAKLWRWNAGGLGYSTTGYFGTYETAITSTGQINASLITTGTLNAALVNIQNLTATMFTGNVISLGGTDSSRLEVKDTSNNVLVKIDKNGLECFGEEVGGIIPSVVFDKNGLTAYSDSTDKENTAIFWTNKDQFHMKNAVVENEASFGGQVRFVPVNSGTNKGIAIVALA